MNDRDNNILKHILEYCDKLKQFTADMDYGAFEKSELHKDACSMCILQIGELVYNLTDEFKDTHAAIPWRQIRSVRNIVAHHYGSVDTETLWDIIFNDIPKLKKFCEQTIIWQ